MTPHFTAEETNVQREITALFIPPQTFTDPYNKPGLRDTKIHRLRSQFFLFTTENTLRGGGVVMGGTGDGDEEHTYRDEH